MSRSKKKNNITGWTTCESEKKDKQLANRKLRKKNKIELFDGKEIFTVKRESSNLWNFGKDGKQFVDNPIYLRK